MGNDSETVEGFSRSVASLAAPFRIDIDTRLASRERSMYEATLANLYVNARNVYTGDWRRKTVARKRSVVSPQGHSKVNCYVCG